MRIRWCSVAKSSKYERTASIPNKRHLPGLCYRPLDERKNSNGDGDAVLLRGKHCFGDSYEMSELPASDYARKYMT